MRPLELQTVAHYTRHGKHRPLQPQMVLCGTADTISTAHIAQHAAEEYGTIYDAPQCVLPGGHAGPHEFQLIIVDDLSGAIKLHDARVAKGRSVIVDICKGCM